MNLRIQSVSIQKKEFRDPVSYFESYSHLPYSVLLTGEGPKDISTHSIIGHTPGFIFEYSASDSFSSDNSVKKKFWNYQEQILSGTDFHEYSYPINKCGIIGYLTYEVNHLIENINSFLKSDYKIPILLLLLYECYVIFDIDKKEMYEIFIKYKEKNNLARKESFPHKKNSFHLGKPIPDSSKEDYIDKILKIQERIREGEVYEVNLSRRFESSFSGNPYHFFKALYKKTPSPFSVYFNLDTFQIVSTSPELFLKASSRDVETRPIKGTIQRGKDFVEDTKNKEKLLSDEKEQAELYMIIDLLRNDLGKISEFGTVKVQVKKKLETYTKVHHLVSIITSRLRKNISYIQLLSSCFPGGSITGCPKIKCMEIINELEEFKRNIYTGSIFILNQKSLMSNVAIRTGTIINGKCYFHSGGAITIDSDPIKEFEETEHKITHFLELSEN